MNPDKAVSISVDRFPDAQAKPDFLRMKESAARSNHIRKCDSLLFMKEELKLWKELYETALRTEKEDPWQKLGNAELLGLRYGRKRDTVYMNTVSDGMEKGIFAYEGDNAFNSCLLLGDIQKAGVSAEFAADSQCALMAFWGRKEDVPADQQRIIHELGYHFEDHEWLYFLSQEEGTIPVAFRNEEIIRFTKYLKDYQKLFSAYVRKDIHMDPFTQMYCIWYRKDSTQRGVTSLPFTEYQISDLYLDDENMIEQIQEAGRSSSILEISIGYLRVPVYTDEKGRPLDHPENPLMGIIGDRIHRTVVDAEYGKSIDEVRYRLAEALLQYMKENGVPQEVHVRDIIVESAIRNICDVADTELEHDPVLQVNDDFLQEFIQYTMNQTDKKLS